MNATTVDVTPELALDVALKIGYGIARRALWYDDRCTWFDAIPVGPGLEAKSAALGVDVYGGNPGVALFLAQLVARADDVTLRRTARAALRQAFAPVETMRFPLGFYAGTAGTGVAAIYAGRDLGDEEFVERGRALLMDVVLAPEDPDASDLIGGTAGTLLSLVLAYTALGDDALLARAHDAARIVIGLARRNADGSLSWSTMRDRIADLTGFGHGAAGIAHALLALHAVAPDPALRDAVDGALAYERSVFSPEQQNWPDYRWFGTGPKVANYPISWCHGAAGIVRSRMYAESAGLDVSADVNVGLRTTALQAERQLADIAGDTTLCHGLFGSVDALIDGVRAGRTEYAPLVARCAAEAAQRHHFADWPWPSGLLTHEPIDGLMMGNAGIGHVYLRLADPALQSVLAPAPPFAPR
jgi:lantibiotic modifying enzyme